MRVVVAIVVAVAACGRFRFDERHDAGGVGGCDFRALATGRSFTCGLDALGGVWCWGVNENGQVAVGGPRAVLTATPIALPSSAAQIDAGRDFACARLDDGTVWCWGANQFGELGGATTEPRSGPVQIPLGAERAIDLALGGRHACIRRQSESAIMCWGENPHLELGNTAAGVQPPTMIAGTAGTTQLAIGHRHGCLVDAAERAHCWGRDDGGHLGDGLASGPRAAPAPVVGLNPVRRIVPGGGFTCAIETSGDVRCWGRNEAGQIADASYLATAAPGPAIVTDARELVLQSEGACVTRGDDTMTCWGAIDGGGTGATIATPRITNATGLSQLTGSFYHSCGFANGAPQCWGNNADGELGRGTRGAVAEPMPVALAASPTQIAGDGGATCVLAGDAVYCWGHNPYAQLGDPRVGIAGMREVATRLTGILGIAAGSSHFCAWNSTTVRCWGANPQGQLGDGMMVHDSPPVTANIGAVVRVDAGASHTCAQLAGSIQCWGNNGDGQLGNGTNMASLMPVTVANITAPTALSTAVNHNCVVEGGAVKCWGWNAFGQLGDNTMMNRRMPVTLAIPGTVTSVSVSKLHSCAVTSTGAVYCWGNNASGQLGQGDRLQRLIPTVVMLPGSAMRIEAGGNSTCATLTTGVVYCWGSGTSGALANGVFEDSLLPIEIASLAGASEIVEQERGGCALRAGALECWGYAQPDAGASDVPQPVTLTCTP